MSTVAPDTESALATLPSQTVADALAAGQEIADDTDRAQLVALWAADWAVFDTEAEIEEYAAGGGLGGPVAVVPVEPAPERDIEEDDDEVFLGRRLGEWRALDLVSEY